jgi:iron complex transport system substrate-binding protein
MKTKNKVIALVEIAIVLCSLLLVALPAIAAEQTTQKVSATANTITTASEDDYVLGIYGNANEDDTIDMRDLTYVKLIFFGKKPETELADAKYDDKINPLDFIQIKLIIVGKEKELTFVDSAERIVTAKMPLKRIVVAYGSALEMLRAIKVEKDRIVGVPERVQSSAWGKWGINYKIFFPEYQDIPTVGYVWNPDVEVMLNQNPDVVLLFKSTRLSATQDVLESAGIPTISLYAGVYNKEVIKETKKLGYIFDKRDEAEEFINWYKDIMNSINEKVEKIPEEDKPKVYYEGTKSYYAHSEDYGYVTIPGGKNIFEDMESYGAVDPEAVIVRDPVIIVKKVICGGYHLDADMTTCVEKAREEIMSRPELQNVNAVKIGRVYVISEYITSGGPAYGFRGFLRIMYMAKWFHPELFEDLDPKAIHQEYLDRFQGLDIDLDKTGVFVYPEPS